MKTENMTEEEMAAVLEEMPSGICFASAEDRARLAAIVKVELSGEPRRKLLVINGDGPCSGKTTLAQWVLGLRYGERVKCLNGDIPKEHDYYTAAEVGYMWLEDVRQLKDRGLARMVSHPYWSVRKLRATRCVEKVANVLFVITGNCIQFSEDLFRRAEVVNLTRLAFADIDLEE